MKLEQLTYDKTISVINRYRAKFEYMESKSRTPKALQKMFQEKLKEVINERS